MRNERGSVLVFITLLIVLLLVMVGIGLDTGWLTYTRSRAQAVVDAAALSAVSGLPLGTPATVEARAAAFNDTHDYAVAPVNVSYVRYDFSTNSIVEYNAAFGNANGVRVAMESGEVQSEAFLTPLFNLLGIGMPSSRQVDVSAVATISSKPSIPIAIWSGLCPETDYTVKTDVRIQVQHPTRDDDGENACWTTFKDCSSGAADIKALFKISEECSPSSSIDGVTIGTEICQNRGQANTALFEAEEFFTEHSDVEWWTVPVIGGGGNCDPQNPTEVVNWAKIRPTDFQTTGNPKYIVADLMCGPDLINEATGSLCYSHRLVREPSKGY